MSSSVQFDSGKTRMLSPCATPAVVEAPELGALVLGVPLAEVVAEGEDALLGAGLLLVAAGTAEEGVEAVLLRGLEQDRRLDPVARAVGLLGHGAPVDRVLDRGDDELDVELVDPPVAVLEHLGEVQAGVDVHDRERDPSRREGLLGQPEHHDRVLAAGEEQAGALHLGSHLADDVDALGLERANVAEAVVTHREEFSWVSPTVCNAATSVPAISGCATTRSGSQGFAPL